MAGPDAVDAGDPQQDEDDPILVEGYRLAKELIVACDTQGRKRRLEAYGSNATHILGQAGQQTPRPNTLVKRTGLVADATSLRDPLSASTQPRPLASNRFAAGSNGLENDSARPEPLTGPGRV